MNGLIFSLLACVALTSNATDLKLAPDNIDRIVKAMTLDEKCHFVVGGGQMDSADSTELIILGDCKRIVPGCAGITYPIERLGIPSIVLADGPAGLRIDPRREGDERTYFCTGFPIGTLLASTWDPEVIRSAGAGIGQEVLEYGVDVLLGPGANIHRNPLCGRNFEYFSEDPLLSGLSAAAYINGVQSAGVGTSLKHFALNNSEINRLYCDSRVSARALREIYLRNFEIAVKHSDPWTIMTSYNYLNGIYTSENRELLETLLRGEYGFKGMIMTDWGGGQHPIEQMKAGNDMIQSGHGWMCRQIKKAVEEGKLAESDLDACVKRILELIVKTPRFNGYKFSNSPAFKEHAQLVRRTAPEGFVLLKNERGTLPLKKGESVALFGASSYRTLAGGWGSGDVNKAYTVNLDEGLRGCGVALNIDTDKAYRDYCSTEIPRINALNEKATFCGYHWIPEEMDIESTRKLAKAAAISSDRAIITISRLCGEGTDRMVKDNFCLKESELGLLKIVCESFHSCGKSVSVVLNIGGAVETASWKDLPDAILVAWLPGQEAGYSIADALTGAVNPSGRLPMTFPNSYGDVPSQNFPILEADTYKNDSFYHQSADKLYEIKDIDYIDYTEDIYVGYRHYCTYNLPVSYPFGYGLSYTDFKAGNVKASKAGDVKASKAGDVKASKAGDVKASKAGDGWDVCVTVTNTGNCPGRDVVQIYSKGNSACPIAVPARELKGFAKTGVLEPGESQVLTIHIDAMDLASFDQNACAWLLCKGSYAMTVAPDAASDGIDFTLKVGKTQKKAVNDILRPVTENGAVPEGQLFIGK